MLKRLVKKAGVVKNSIETLYSSSCNCCCTCTCKDSSMLATEYMGLQAIPKSNASNLGYIDKGGDEVCLQKV